MGALVAVRRRCYAGRLSTVMKIAYVFDRPLPARETDSEQALQTIAAFSRQGAEILLVLPASEKNASAEELAAHYQVKGRFEVLYADNPVAAWSSARKLWHASVATQSPDPHCTHAGGASPCR